MLLDRPKLATCTRKLLRRLGHEFVMRHREFGSINHILIENGIGFISS